MKVGDYVEILPGVYDESMPHGRRDGLIVELIGKRKDQAIIMFCNKAFLKFHTSQLKKLECKITQKELKSY